MIKTLTINLETLPALNHRGFLRQSQWSKTNNCKIKFSVLMRETRTESFCILQFVFLFQEDGNSRANRGLMYFSVTKTSRVWLKTLPVFHNKVAKATITVKDKHYRIKFSILFEWTRTESFCIENETSLQCKLVWSRAKQSRPRWLSRALSLSPLLATNSANNIGTQ